MRELFRSFTIILLSHYFIIMYKNKNDCNLPPDVPLLYYREPCCYGFHVYSMGVIRHPWYPNCLLKGKCSYEMPVREGEG